MAHGLLEFLDPAFQAGNLDLHAGDSPVHDGLDCFVHAFLLLGQGLHEGMRFLQLVTQPGLELLGIIEGIVKHVKGSEEGGLVASVARAM